MLDKASFLWKRNQVQEIKVSPIRRDFFFSTVPAYPNYS